jgi:hypothetical protein
LSTNKSLPRFHEKTARFSCRGIIITAVLVIQTKNYKDGRNSKFIPNHRNYADAGHHTFRGLQEQKESDGSSGG